MERKRGSVDGEHDADGKPQIEVHGMGSPHQKMTIRTAVAASTMSLGLARMFPSPNRCHEESTVRDRRAVWSPLNMRAKSKTAFSNGSGGCNLERRIDLLTLVSTDLDGLVPNTK